MYICLQTFNTSLLRLKIANTEITVECLHIHYAFQGLALRIGLPQNTSSPSASNRTIKQKFDKCKLQLRKQSSYKRSLYGTLVRLRTCHRNLVTCKNYRKEELVIGLEGHRQLPSGPYGGVVAIAKSNFAWVQFDTTKDFTAVCNQQ